MVSSPNPVRALIVDDEAPARSRLRKLLKPLETAGRINIVGEARDGVEALDQLAQLDVDLLLLDVQMPELTGFDVLDRLPVEGRPVVVFTTAYDEYAVKAFEANAVDYLLKPISAERLEKAVERVEKLRSQPAERSLSDERFGKLLEWLDQQATQGISTADIPADYARQISIPFRDRILVVRAENILSAEVRDGITRLVVLDEKPGSPPKVSSYIVSYTLDQLEANFDPAEFLRVHRSAIIRVDKIREMISWFSGRYKVVLEGGHEVIASRERSKVLRAKLTL